MGAQPVRKQNEVLVEYYPMVQRIAYKAAATYGAPVGVDVDDLVSSGIIGLAEAWDRFDPERGVAFVAYAVPRVRGAIIDAIRASDWVPRKARMKARETGEPVASLISFDGSQSDGETDAPGRIADKDTPEPGFELLAAEQRQELLLALNRLPERERYIISAHYFEGVQLAHIAGEFGVTESRVSQLHGRALRMLREGIESVETSEAA